MKKKFPNITYDLPQNIIRCKGEMESLKIHSLNLCIGKAFKEFIINYYTALRFMYSKSVTNNSYKTLECLEEKVYDKILTDLRSISCGSVFPLKMIQKNVHFTGMQLIDFIKKRKTYLHLVDLEKFIPAMVFTSQGTINILKTILRNNNTLQEISLENFILKCHFFLKNEIKVWFDRLEEKDVAFAVEKSLNDYVLEFWLLEIRSLTFTTTEEAKKNYLEANSDKFEVFFMKAIEAKNEIGVVYLWNNVISKLKKGRTILYEALNIFVSHSLKINILMFLIFQIYENEFDEFFEKSFIVLVENMTSEARWHSVFYKITDELDTHRFSKTFDILTKSCLQVYPEGIDLDSLVHYFSILPKSVRIFIRNAEPKPTSQPQPSTSKIKNNYEIILARAISTGREDLVQELKKIKEGVGLKHHLKSDSIVPNPKRFKTH